MKYKCIIFDCDGILVDSEATSIGVLVQMASEIGVHIDFSKAMQLYSGQSLSYCLHHIEQQSNTTFSDNKIEYFRQKTYRAFRQDLKAIPGVEQVLQKLDVPVCVASNAPLEKIKLNLNLLNFSDYFKGKLYSAYDIQKWKPEPDLFLYAAAQMGFDIHDCAVIEDSVAGVQAAVKGGFDVYAYASINNDSQLKAEGGIVFNHMSQLITLLNETA